MSDQDDSQLNSNVEFINFPNEECEPHHFNSMYRKLALSERNSDHPIVGLVAYSIYKKEKYNWIQEFKQKEERKPTDEEIEMYFLIHYGDERTNQLFDLALKSLIDFSSHTVGKEIEILNKKHSATKEKLEKEHQKRLRKLATKFKKPTFLGTMGLNITTSAAIILIYFTIYAAGILNGVNKKIENYASQGIELLKNNTSK